MKMPVLVCLECNMSLEREIDGFGCRDCDLKYPKEKGVYFFSGHVVNKKHDSEGYGIIYSLKEYIKKYPKFFYILAWFFGGMPLGITAKKFVREISDEKCIVSIGAGTKFLREDVVNIDISPRKGVHIVADATHLPIESNSVDAVVCDQVLEHVSDPIKIVNEIYRILKPDGKVYVGVPFIIHFHSSPDDYYRWTMKGLREIMKDFREVCGGVGYGPGAAFVYILCEWMAMLFSFGFEKLYQILFIIFLILFSPLKLFDFLLVKYRFSQNMTLGFYFIGEKIKKSK